MQTNENNLFLAASRRQLRFNTNKGPLAVDDLWSLSLRDLDRIGQAVNVALEPSTKSFLTNPDPKISAAQVENQLRLDILKEVIAIKEAENRASVAAAANRTRREFLTQLLVNKEVEGLQALSKEEIQAQLAALEG